VVTVSEESTVSAFSGPSIFSDCLNLKAGALHLAETSANTQQSTTWRNINMGMKGSITVPAELHLF
jgi:hypothetical protein